MPRIPAILTAALAASAVIAFAGTASFAAARPETTASAAENMNQTPAFPGAVGYGAKATGGRGGEVYRVTTLADSGPGSFRDAVSKGHRIIVFTVGGYVDLKSPVVLSSDLTIDGQTAPGDGVCIRNYEISLEKQKNVIIRYVRIRQGLTPKQDKKYALSLNDCSTVILDHCSIEWGRWDCIGLSRSNNVTLQYCLIGQSIDPQRFGCLCQSDYVTLSHNLWIDNQSRNPKAKGKIQYVNNVVYNWGVTGYVGGHSGADHQADLLNNYFIKGPSSSERFAGEFTATDHIYQSGNLADMNRDGELNGRSVVAADLGTVTIEDHPYLPLPAKLDSAEEAYRKVVAGAGDALHRDPIDLRLLDEVKSLGKKGSITHDPAALGGFGTLKGGEIPVDSDGDGIPDAWETAHGLNPKDPSDAAKPLGGSGYTAIEVYLNSVASTED